MADASVAPMPSQPPPRHEHPVSFDNLLDLAGPGPTPDPQRCRRCDGPNVHAMLLECLHSVCGDCMASMSASVPAMVCPTCQIPSRISTRALVRDYVAGHFLAVSDSERGRGDHVCAVHEVADVPTSPEPATFYCVSCLAFMCSICTADHREQTASKAHTIVFLDDMTPEMVSLPVTCPSHGDANLISGFCATCHIGVCANCMLSDHDAHTLVTVDLDTTIYTGVCHMLGEEVARPVPPATLDSLATTLRTLDDLLVAVTANMTTTCTAIDDWARDGSAVRQARAHQLRTELMATCDVHLTALATQRRDVAQRVYAVAQARSYVTALRRVSTPRELLMTGAFVKRRLSALRSWLRPIEPCVSRGPITISLDASIGDSDVAAHGAISAPVIQPWQQGRPPRREKGDVCIYVVGGEQSSLPTMERYDPYEDTWEALPHPMSRPRGAFACVVVHARLYAIGGELTTGVTRSVELFDTASRTWNDTCAPMAEARKGHACVTFREHIYTLGGGSDEGVVERYDPRTNVWEQRTSTVADRFHAACVVLGSHIYVTGGTNILLRRLKSVLRYDPTADTWEQLTAMPISRDHHAAAAMHGYLYAIGGTSQWDDHVKRVDRFDPVTGLWSHVAPLMVGRYGHAAIVEDDRIFVFGGGSKGMPYMSAVEAYDYVRDAWAPCTEMGTPRRSMGAALWEAET